MSTKINEFEKLFLKKDLPDIRPGDTVRVYHKFKELITKGKKSVEEKERVQVFEGLVIARKHGRGINSTITVRKIISGVGVEKIFPLHSPMIEKIEILSRAKVRRAKLYYLREKVGKTAKLKRKPIKPQTLSKSESEKTSSEVKESLKEKESSTHANASEEKTDQKTK